MNYIFRDTARKFDVFCNCQKNISASTKGHYNTILMDRQNLEPVLILIPTSDDGTPYGDYNSSWGDYSTQVCRSSSWKRWSMQTAEESYHV